MTYNLRLTIKIVTVLVLVIGYWSLVISPVKAQTENLESTLEGVKGQVENLVTAKDEKSVGEFALRIETFKKVIEFSVSEAKDLKIRLLGLDNLSDEENVWRETVVKELNNALDHYNKQKLVVEDTTEINLDKIKKLAADFKNWRNNTYLPVAERVNEFLLIHQEEKAIETTLRRWARINEDIIKLEKARIKGVEKLRELLERAGDLIDEGEKLNDEAGISFWRNYILTSTSTATSTATSTLPEETTVATTTDSINIATSSFRGDTSDGTSTDESATSTLSVSPPSIKGLVGDSLDKIREAYQVFIEMSNLVRKLLS